MAARSDGAGAVTRYASKGTRWHVLSLAALALLTGCLGEVVQNPSARRATVQFSALFSSQTATDELETPRSARVVVTRIRRDAEGRDTRTVITNLIKDLSYLQNSEDDSAVIAVDFPLGAATDRYEVTVAVANAAGDTIYRAGPGGFAADGRTGDATLTLPVVYTGPGANATAITISPRTRVLSDQEQFTFGATVLGPNGQPLARSLVRWESSNPSIAAPLSERSGTVRANQTRGTAWIRALVEGTALRDSVLVTVNLRATGLQLVSGGGQTAGAGSSLAQPVVFRVRATDGVSVAGVTVNFAPQGPGASVSPASAVSDQNGLVDTRWTLGTTVGPQTLQATSPAIPGFTATATATASRVTPASATVQVLSVLPTAIERSTGTATVTVLVSAGTVPVQGETVTFSATGAAGTSIFEPATASVVTGADGRATILFRATESGTKTITARIGNQATGTGTVQVADRSNAAAALVIISGNQQTVKIGTLFPLDMVVEARNAAGQPMEGAFIDWGSASGDVRRVTGSDGRSTVTYALLPNSPVGVGLIPVRIFGTNIQVVFEYTAVP